VSLLTRHVVEAFEGPPGPWTYFTDASPGTGIFATIGGLSAVQASERAGPATLPSLVTSTHVSESPCCRRVDWRGEQTCGIAGAAGTVSTVDNAEWADLQLNCRASTTVCG